MRRLFGAAALLLLVTVAATSTLSAQRPRGGGRAEIFAGSELENYLRYLQTDSTVAPYPWSLRGFSPVEIERLLPDSVLEHPWRRHYDIDRRASGRYSFDWVRPAIRIQYNTGFPYGTNDGAVWAGRGLTTSVTAGLALRAGRLSLTLAPIFLRAENDGFVLAPNGLTGKLIYADAGFPLSVDRPQRFGNDPYTVIDPGQSTVRYDTRFITVGASTANQWWGPTSEFPFILGNNAAGFPHLFLGSGRPWNLWLFRLHGRVVYGRLEESRFSNSDHTGALKRRFMSGAVAVIQPRGLPGVELGAARFYHTPWPEGGLQWKNWKRPFETFLKEDIENRNFLDNQLASIFGRWVLASSGFEVYAEYGREDHNWDLRDLIVESQHSSTYVFGGRKMWRRSDDHLSGFLLEVWNGRIPLTVNRGEGGPYYHTFASQGHTYRGQLLGSGVGVGGTAATTLQWDRYDAAGRWRAKWTRALWQQSAITADATIDAGKAAHTLLVERARFFGPADVTLSGSGTYLLGNHPGKGWNTGLAITARLTR
jgi:hypothetical protein